MAARSPAPFSRRQFLVAGGATAGAVLLGACGGGDDTTAGGVTSTTDASPLVLAQFFGGPVFVAGTTLRAPFGVADEDGLLPTERAPKELEVTITDAKGRQVGDPVTVTRHADGLPRPYFPLEVVIADPGFYTVSAELAGSPAEMSIEVKAAGEVVVIQPGATLPTLETPTVADARGVDPICTRDPVCPLHDVTAAAAVAAGTPVALLIASPAFCQIAICGPVLDVLLDVLPSHPKVKGLHVEVYTDPKKDLESYAPTVGALGLHFEPCLVLVGSDGKVRERLDTIFDRAELGEALGRLS